MSFAVSVVYSAVAWKFFCDSLGRVVVRFAASNVATEIMEGLNTSKDHKIRELDADQSCADCIVIPTLPRPFAKVDMLPRGRAE